MTIIRIEVAPQWRFHREEDAAETLVLLDLLHEIRATGKISTASQRSGLSYRHAWNLVEGWGTFFGSPLVERKRGKGTHLTTLGEKLVWAGQRLDARLGPQLQNLAQELETEVNQLLFQGPTGLRIHASHGFAVSKLKEMLDREKGMTFDLRYVSNPASLVSLVSGTCDLAGMHLPQGALRKLSIAAVQGLIDGAQHRVIGFVTREMGLIVKQGNPLKIYNLERLLDSRIRFVNRDSNSGSRLLFDQLLDLHEHDSSNINGYEQTEFTHAAVAAYVASGMADVAFGVEAAARQFGLDFVRLATEDYFFVCQAEALEFAPLQRVMNVMRSDAFHEDIRSLPGYIAKNMGHVRTVREAFGADVV